MNSTSKNAENKTVNNPGIAAKFIILSLIGIFVFFVPIRAGGASTIPVEFLVSYLISSFKPVVRLYALAVILIAAVLPFIRKTWKKDALTTVFTFSKILGRGGSIIYAWMEMTGNENPFFEYYDEVLDICLLFDD